jgi:hypothetical protein
MDMPYEKIATYKFGKELYATEEAALQAAIEEVVGNPGVAATIVGRACELAPLLERACELGMGGVGVSAPQGS